MGRDAFAYTVLSVVPRVERGERFNAGVVLFCRQRGFLGARTQLDPVRLSALAPGCDADAVRAHLDGVRPIAAGDAGAGPIAREPQSERFGWLAAPSSTMLQPGPVHTGITDDPVGELDRLFDALVAPAPLDTMRRSYTQAGLREQDVAPTWLAQFEAWFAEARATAAIVEPNAMVLGTTGGDGQPSARTVLLKGVDGAGLRLYTNLDSRKGRELTGNPRASLVFPWYPLQRQVVVTGRVERLSAEQSDAYFASRPRGSQLGAAASPQSEVIESREVLERLRAELDARHPGVVPRPAHWGGLLVVPETVEFWQGRPDRLHDRLRFTRDDATSTGFRLERLAP